MTKIIYLVQIIGTNNFHNWTGAVCEEFMLTAPSKRTRMTFQKMLSSKRLDPIKSKAATSIAWKQHVIILTTISRVGLTTNQFILYITIHQLRNQFNFDPGMRSTNGCQPTFHASYCKRLQLRYARDRFGRPKVRLLSIRA